MMKKILPLLFPLLPLLAVSFAGSAQTAEHVVIITVDGFRPDFYLDSSWDAVNIRGLMKQGTYAYGVNSDFPSITYPSHTTIVTGVMPVRHGIYYNNVFEPAGSTGKMYWNAGSIKAPTLWEAAHEKGLKVASLLWPVSADAPVLYDIPDIGGMGDSVREAYSKPAGFTRELRENVFGGADKINYGKDENTGRIAAYVIRKDKPALMTVHLFSVDHFQHEQGRNGPLVRAAVADADSAVGIIVDALKDAGIWDKTVIIVTGDHGFLNVTESVNPNVWLAGAGLITDIKKDDWKAQFYSAGGSTYLYLKDKNDKETLAKVIGLLEALPEEDRNFFRIIDRPELDRIGGNPEVPLALSGLSGASFGNDVAGPAVKSAHGGTHGYFPDFREIQTGFVAHGPGIKQDGMITVMNLKDIAPTVAELLGIPFPSADGKVPAGLLSR
jgi:predicted AlkP superfamily pyrophosphatase or phosphodiesterase